MSLCDESFSWRIFESSVSFGSLSGWFAKMEQYDFISTYQVFQKESGALSTRGTLWWSGGLDCSPCTSHKTLSSCRLLSPAGTLKRKCLWADRYCQPHTMNLEHIWGFQEDGSKGHLWRVCVLWKTFDWWALQVVAGGRMPKPGHHTYASWSHPTQFKSRRAMMTIRCQHCDSH